MTDLTTGPDLDRRVAEAVGWHWNGRPGHDCAACSCETISCHVSERIGDEIEVSRYPSGSDADALAALEATGATGWRVDREPDGYWVCVDCDYEGALASTLPLAICAAILAWKEGQKDE